MKQYQSGHMTDAMVSFNKALELDPSHPNALKMMKQTYEEIEPFSASGRYVNYLAEDEMGNPVAAAYGPNYRRLQEIKTKYDPTNFFHMNQNIPPLS